MSDAKPPSRGLSVADLAIDAAIVAGAGSITYGAWMIYHPAAYIVGGAFLLGAGWLFASRGV